MFGLERYSASLGTPGSGVHSRRFLGLAAVDLLLSALLALFLAPWAPGGLLGSAVGVLLLGIGAHAVFGVPTALNRRLQSCLCRGAPPE